MTAEEEFEAWWAIRQPETGPATVFAYVLAKGAWLASREATYKRCVEICRGRMYASDAADDIEREFGGKP